MVSVKFHISTVFKSLFALSC